MTERDTAQLIKGKLSIPSLPRIVSEIGALLHDPESGIPELGQVIARDPGLAMNLLQVANSAFYSPREEILDLDHAASLLGKRVIGGIVMRLSVIGHYDYLDYYVDFDLKALWRHAVLAALVAQRLCAASDHAAEYGGGLSPDEAYTCGLLHDIGQVVLLDSFGERYVGLLAELERSRRPIQVAESELFGFGHPEVGAVTATMWGLPETVSEAIELHHASREERRESFSASLVTLADQVAYAARSADPAALRPWSEEAERLGVSAAALAEIADFAVLALPGIVV